METSRGHRVEGEEELAAIVRGMHSIAVVGMKGEERPNESAYSIPAMLRERGYRVLAVNPTYEEILGQPSYPDLGSVPEPFDLVDVFRRADHVAEVADAVLALPPERRPRVFWMQSGIRDEEAAERLLAAGLDVVQDRCLGVYAGRYGRR